MDERREKEIELDVTDAPHEDEGLEHRERMEQEERRRDDRAAENRQAPSEAANEELMPLFEDEAARKFRSRWLTIQSKFVDDPRDAVKQADDLVADIIKNVTMGFSDRRVALEKQWNSGADVSTEDMRIALKRYRSFFERLLSLES